MTPRLLIALTQKGAAIPKSPMMLPASAGPTARLMLTPTLLAATAGMRSCAGTSSGTIACQAGAVSAPPAPIRNIKSKSRVGVTWPNPTRAANIADTSVVAPSRAIRNLRLSTMSASAPAGRANRNIGRLVATWTRATTSGLGSRLTISQPDAALYIQVPTLETTVAIQITVNARWRNAPCGGGGAFPEPVRCPDTDLPVVFTLTCLNLCRKLMVEPLRVFARWPPCGQARAQLGGLSGLSRRRVGGYHAQGFRHSRRDS